MSDRPQGDRLEAAIRAADEAETERARVEAEARLVACRHEAASERVNAAQQRPASGFAGAGTIDVETFPPEVPSDELDPGVLADALEAASCLRVDGLLDDEEIAWFVAGIDRAFDGIDEWIDDQDGEVGPWFRPFSATRSPVQLMRPWMREGGGVFAADSPRVHRRWCAFIRRSGLLALMTELFGEVPVGSMDKCALRRIEHGAGIEWHQDGRFLSLDAGAVNVWVALTSTRDAPGLEIVPRRFDEIVETGTNGASYDWSVGPATVNEVAGDRGTVSPEFRPGDALVFDGRLLHRTECRQPPPTGTRYAIETWFFRPSSFPGHQEIPVAF